MKKKNDFLTILNDYFSVYLSISKGLSENTIKSYKDTFRLLMIFFKEEKNLSCDKISFSSLEEGTVSQFLFWLEEKRGCSVSSRNQRLAALSSFSLYAQNRNFEAASVFRNAILKIPSKKAINSKRAYFSTEEIKILLSLPDENTNTGLRDKVLLSFLYATGMRAQEVCDIKVKDLCFKNNPVSLTILGKGGKRRSISIPEKASSMIEEYIKHRNLTNKYDRHVFSSQTHEQMSVSCVEEIFKKYVSIAKEKYPSQFLDKYSPHSMRHTTACHMIEAGIPLIAIKNFLGHSSITTTEIYTEITQNVIDKNVKLWNEKWFSKSVQAKPKENRYSIPEFLF